MCGGALIITGTLGALSGCSTMGMIHESADKAKAGDYGHADAMDPALNLTRDDYRNLHAPKSGGAEPLDVKIEKDAPPIPKIEDILAAPRPPKIGETQLVSIAVTDDVPLKDVLLELAKLADVDIEIDSGITGGIEFIAKDKPFNEVIDRISDLAGLRYTMKGGVLRVERDTPYIQSYPINFLNLDRDSDSSVNLSTNVLSTSVSNGGSGGSGGGGGSSGGSGGVNTGSTSSVKSSTKGDFWKSLEAGVTQILSYQPVMLVSSTTMQAETDANLIKSANAAPGAAAAPALTPIAAPPAAVNTANVGNAALAGKNYTINRQAGVLTINGTSRQQDMISRLLDMLKRNASAQVLIEAKVIEVDLNDQYASGVNWQVVGTKLGIGTIGVVNALTLPANPLASTTSNLVSFTASSNASDILQLLQSFGTTRTLSSPRLHAINNQQSTLTFAENKVYFQLSINTTTNLSTSTSGGAAAQTAITSTVSTVPIGIMMTMMPSIDLENNEVTLSVRPTLSTVIDTVPDPAFALEAASFGLTGVSNLVPEVQVRELDSTLKLKSGQTMVIGGLMQQEAQDTDSGVPFANAVPIIGNLFKSVTKSTHNKELILLIKATIVNAGGDLNKTDHNIFNKFSNDPRPISF